MYREIIMRFTSLFTISFLLLLVPYGYSLGHVKRVIELQPGLAAMFGKAKKVTISFRNESGSTLELRIGEETTELKTGSTVTRVLPWGAQVLVNKSTPTHKAGEVLLPAASSQLDQATLVIH